MNNRISEVSFGSTYRIPITQPGINKPKKAALRKFIKQFQNYLIPSSDTGYIRLSVRKRLDERVEAGLKSMGFSSYQKFDRHNIHKKNIDQFIKDAINAGTFKVIGNLKKLLEKQN